MATSTSWRSNNAGGGPRWGQGGAVVQQNSQPSSVNGAPTPTPRSTCSNIVGRSASTAELEDSETIQRDRMMYLLVALVGNTIVATTRSGAKFVGILSTTSMPRDGSRESLGIVVSCAQEMLKDGSLGPMKRMLMIKGEDLDTFTAKDVGLDVPVSMASANRAGFRTDTEISKKALESFGEGRMLQKWADDVDSPLESNGGIGDVPYTGLTSSTGSWDQFAANEAKFGVKSNYEETMYTTKLDKSGKDYKDRERKAEQLAREIMNSSTNNVHVAEERNIADETQTEEDRFGAVVRSPNAYVPPAARRAAAVAAAAGVQNTIKATGAAREDKATAQSQTIPTITSTPAAKEGAGTETSATHGQATPTAVEDFRQFVSSEKERMEKKRAAVAKKEKESKLADLKSWGDKFKLKFPGGSEVGSEKTASEKPRDLSLQKSLSPATAEAQKTDASAGNLSVHVSPPGETSRPAPTATSSSATTGNKNQLAETKAMLSKMTIPKIPPFNPDKARSRQSEGQQAPASPAPSAASKSTFKLSAKASTFKPFNPNAAAFTPGAGPATAAAGSSSFVSRASSENPSTVGSPLPVKVAGAISPSVSAPSNPFFGNRMLKKTTPLHVREDFNPFKNAKVPEAQTVGPTWGFSGKGYRNLFHAIPAEEVTGSSSSSSSIAAPMVPHSQQGPSPMASMHAMMPVGMHHHPAMQPGVPAPGPGPHMQPQHAMNGGQAFYMPYGAPAQAGPYRFQGGQQGLQQMPAGYGQMPPHYMPFSPPIPANAPPVYSPQMGNMFPHSSSMHNMGLPPGGPPRNGQMQGKVPPPPHMYYPNAAPFAPNSAGGPMSPLMRHPQLHQQPQPQAPPPSQHPTGAAPPPPPQQQQQQPQQQQQQQPMPSQQPRSQSGTPSQLGSTSG